MTSLPKDHFSGGRNLTNPEGLVETVNSQQASIDALQQGSIPSGPAGGVLDGTYPDPDLVDSFGFTGVPQPTDGVQNLVTGTTANYSTGARSKKVDIDADAKTITVSGVDVGESGVLEINVIAGGVSTLTIANVVWGTAGAPSGWSLANGAKHTIFLYTRTDGTTEAVLNDGA